MARRTQTKFLLTVLAGLAAGALARLVVRRVKEEEEGMGMHSRKVDGGTDLTMEGLFAPVL